jgi:2,3-bisphosphoglycerate-dependent phosphoglycerate mutase
LVVVQWQTRGEQSVWLVRHGESTWNALGLVQGQDDTATLTARGRHQSVKLSERFRHSAVGAVYASDLQRARQTATPLATAHGIPVQTDPALRERCFGIFQGGPVDALHPGVTGIRGEGVVNAHARPVGGESLDDVQNRVALFVDWLGGQSHEGDVVVVVHGGSLRAIRNYCAGKNVEEMRWDVVANGSVWPVRLPGTVTTVTHQEDTPNSEGSDECDDVRTAP